MPHTFFKSTFTFFRILGPFFQPHPTSTQPTPTQATSAAAPLDDRSASATAGPGTEIFDAVAPVALKWESESLELVVSRRFPEKPTPNSVLVASEGFPKTKQGRIPTWVLDLPS